MILIGDVHNLMYDYKEILKAQIKNGETESIILGDVGLGFPTSYDLDTSDVEGNHRFIRGNHDNPEVCRAHPQYLGDYGVLKGDWCGDHHYEKMFFMSGAWSIDKDWRTPMISWWPEEELKYNEMSDAISFYKNVEPDIVITHDCPLFVLYDLLYPGGRVFSTATGQALEQMWNHHQPSLWVFAHHHVSKQMKIKDTQFVCLNELEVFHI